MNEPLKFKLFSVYGQILNMKVLSTAWEHVKANKGAGGIDGISIKDYEKNLTANLNNLLDSLKQKTYKPSPVKRVYIPKKNGKKRPLGIPVIQDRIVQQALADRLQPFFEKEVFHDSSCGFRTGRGVQDALERVLRNIEDRYWYIYDFDIKGCFDNIPHKHLMKVLNKYISDGTVLDIIWKSLKAGYMEDGIQYTLDAGTVQGAVFSPLCANIYMNELDWRTETQTREVEQTNEAGESETTNITETVLVIELTHHTPEEMRETYHFTDRQNEYLTLLSGEDTATLWGELLGGFVQSGEDIMAPGMDTDFADGALQWPLPVEGTITSPQGYRTDPITGEISYHSGTDISAPEGTPILAAADGTVTIANATDSWGGSYGYYVKIDHGGGLTTLYAHCSSICVTVGRQVLAGQVVAYVGQTGRATGPHLHFEVQQRK